jgi:8-oxo-dGTP pyrophosphatase MutT (NUDIX family)
MKATLDPEKWKEAFAGDLPGEAARQLMAPDYRGPVSRNGDPIAAGVLILMYPLEGETMLVFMKRNAYDGPHSAQVCFPGGAHEAGDHSLVDTAIRETREELGIDQELTILGGLSSLHIPVSNYLVSPFAGWTPERPVFRPDPTEVQYLIETGLGALMDPQNIREETTKRYGRKVRIPYYRVGNEKVWGATAMILAEFLQLAARMQ